MWNKVEKKKRGKLVFCHGFEFYWWQKQQQAESHFIENTQLHDDNQLKEEHPDICNEESEERSIALTVVRTTKQVKKMKQNLRKQLLRKSEAIRVSEKLPVVRIRNNRKSSLYGPWLKRNWEKKITHTHIFTCIWFSVLVECLDFISKWIIWASHVYRGGSRNPVDNISGLHLRWGYKNVVDFKFPFLFPFLM